MQEHENVAVLGSDMVRFGMNLESSVCNFARDFGQMKVDMLFACGVAHPSVMMRACVIRDLGGYDLEYNGMEDYELWVRVLRSHCITTLPEVLLRYRIHDSQVTRNPSPRHLEQMRRLKCRQLAELGIAETAAEPFFRFCLEGKPADAEKIKALDAFFVQADAANSDKQLYDAQKLRAVFHAVILSAALRLPRAEQKQLAAQCGFLNKHQLQTAMVKQCIKKLLGRN